MKAPIPKVTKALCSSDPTGTWTHKLDCLPVPDSLRDTLALQLSMAPRYLT